MPKAPSPFTGIKLTEQTPLAESSLDQKLFSHSTPQGGTGKPKGTEPVKESRNLASKEASNLGTKEP
jgi:hypothetical protein